MKRPRLSTRVRKEVERLERAGWVATGQDSRGHHVMEHPDASGRLTIANSPGVRQWERIVRNDAAGLLGIPVPVLLERMGVVRGKTGKLRHRPNELARKRRSADEATADDIRDVRDRGVPKGASPATEPLVIRSSAKQLERECLALKERLLAAGGDDARELERELGVKRREYEAACRRERRAA